MALTPGTSIGHYEILSSIGAGGMGEVYKAHDRRLGRDVAIKILPEAFAADAGRLSRFQREATLLASLNHPHIAHVHGMEEWGSRPALVMELVDGEDLSQRLATGAVPLDDALRLAIQIAHALQAAHDLGIVHRDLKPANVKVRPDGVVKVLDFGLAKGPSGADPVSANSPTLTASATQPGVILGTAAYMAPEQARGRSVDRRADIWSFGCVLYELLAGRACFRAETVTETLARVLEREPDWDRLPPTTPATVRRVLRRCLEKDVARRFHDIADVRLELEDALSRPDESGGLPAATVGRWWPWAFAAAAVLLGLVGVYAWRTGRASAPPAPESQLLRLTNLLGLEEAPSLSPDGRAVAFTAPVGNTRRVFVQLLAGGNPLLLTHDDTDHQMPRWAPDSSAVVYFSPAGQGATQGTIWEVAALGGVPRRVSDSIGGADISAMDGRLAFFRLAKNAIALTTANRDGSTQQVVREFEPLRYYLYPRWSPDGRWIAFQQGDSIRFDIFVVAASGGEPRQITRENNMLHGFAWLPDASGIVYSSSRGSTMPYLGTASLWQVELEGGNVRQLTWGESSYLHPDLSSNGSIVASRLQLQSDIWRFPVDGAPRDNVARAVRLTRQTGQVLTPTAAPGDREVAFLSDSGGHANLWVVDTQNGRVRQLTQERDPGIAVGVPVWSPDGRAIAFVSSRGNQGLNFGVWLVAPDGSNLRSVANPGLGPAWSADGSWLYYTNRASGTSDPVLQKVAVSGGSPLTVTTEPVRNVIGSAGATLYYMLERPLVDGTPEFEIRAATPDNGPFRVIARISPSRVPIWQIVNPALSPDGQWLAQALTDGYTTNVWGLSTSTGEWRQLTDFGDRATFIARRVSWSSDGRAVLAAVADGDADIVLMNGLLPRRE